MLGSPNLKSRGCIATRFRAPQIENGGKIVVSPYDRWQGRQVLIMDYVEAGVKRKYNLVSGKLHIKPQIPQWNFNGLNMKNKWPWGFTRATVCGM